MDGEYSGDNPLVIQVGVLAHPRPYGMSRREFMQRELLDALSRFLSQNFDSMPLEIREVMNEYDPDLDHFILRIALVTPPKPKDGRRWDTVVVETERADCDG